MEIKISQIFGNITTIFRIKRANGSEIICDVI